MELTQEYVQEWFEYTSAGNLIWRKNRRRARCGDVAGSVHKKSGYRQIMINRKNYYIHRVIFLYHYGYLPSIIDHIDGNRANNRIENLRECTAAENIQNRQKHKRLSSQYKGVCYDKSCGKWIVHITYNQRQLYLGRFESEHIAALVYNINALHLFNKFARLNEGIPPECERIFQDSYEEFFA